MERRTEDIVVPENADIVETIIQLAEEHKAWIYLSDGLIARLKKLYLYKPSESNLEGIIFSINGNFHNFGFSVNTLVIEFLEKSDMWNSVCEIPKKDVRIARNPEVIYFLS